MPISTSATVNTRRTREVVAKSAVWAENSPECER
jgi:hypothetical protein